MPVFYCTHCAAPLEAAATQAGANIECPACRGTVVVPESVMYEEHEAPKPAAYQPYQPPAAAGRALRPMENGLPIDTWRKKGPILGTAAAFVLCLLKKISEPVSSLDEAMGNTGLPRALGGAIGYLLAAGIFALLAGAVIGGIAAARKKSFATVLSRSYALAVVLFSLLMMMGARRSTPASTGAVSSNQNAGTREALDKLEEQIQQFNAGQTPTPASNTPPASTPPTATTTPPSQETGTYDEDAEKVKAVEVTQRYIQELAAANQSYQTELVKTGYLKLLSTPRLKKDTDLSESYTILYHARRLVKEQGEKMREMLASLPERFRASSVHPKIREECARNAEKGVEEAIVQFNESWALEEGILDQASALIGLLKERSGRWVDVNGEIFFREYPDQQALEAIRKKMGELAAQQNEIRRKGAKASSK